MASSSFVAGGRRRGLRFPWLKVWVAVVYVFLFAPIVVLVVFSFNRAKSGTSFHGTSLRWYRRLFDNDGIRHAFSNSLKVSLTATVVATVIGTLAAFALTRYRYRGRAAYSSLIFIPLVIPEVVMGVSLLVLFVNMIHFTLSLRTVIIAHVTFDISFVIVVVKARLVSLDRRLEEAAADLGATPWQTFIRVLLPLAAPGILAGALLAFTISFDDFVITFFTAGVGSTTLPLYVFGQLKFGVSPEINALSSLILAFTTAVLVVALLFGRRAARRGAGIDAASITV